MVGRCVGEGHGVNIHFVFSSPKSSIAVELKSFSCRENLSLIASSFFCKKAIKGRRMT